jgi:hypothetical protein
MMDIRYIDLKGVDTGLFLATRSGETALNAEVWSFHSITEEEQLIGLSSDTFLKIQFLTVSIPQFWIGVQKYCKELSKKYVNILISFATSYFV